MYLLSTCCWVQQYGGREGYDSWETIGLSKDGKHLYIKGIQDNFYILSAADGILVKKMEVMYGLDTTPSPPVETEDKIYFGSKNGVIYSIDKETYEWEPVVFTGTARVHSLILLENNKIAAVNMDGTLVIMPEQ
jgi:outer membrane protein assembly factor BamB